MSHVKIFGVRAVDVINPVKWWSYVKGTVYGMFLEPHILRQVLIRQITCEECVKAGKCVDCGCSMPAKTYDFNARCSLDKWQEVILDKEKWEDIEEKYKIKIKITYGE